MVETSDGVAEATARAEWLAAQAGDPIEQELWLTYAALGHLLDSGRADAAYVDECRDLVDRLIALGKEGDRVYEQARAAWIDRTSRRAG